MTKTKTSRLRIDEKFARQLIEDSREYGVTILDDAISLCSHIQKVYGRRWTLEQGRRMMSIVNRLSV